MGRSGRASVGLKRLRQRVTLRPGGESSLHQRIELLPAYGARTLVALETPTRLGNAVVHTASGSRRTSLVELGGGEVRFVDSGLAYSYEATSLPPEEDSSTKLTEAEHGQLLALPDRLDPRVAELARQVIDGEKDPLAAAQKLSAWLQREYAYTLELGGEVEDPLADFLFVRKAGHCEHFATALTLMLRTQGFSARLASGFFGGERSGEDYILRAGDAHAWTHVLVPGRGFITVDATPPGNRASQSMAALQFLTGLYEALEARWRSSVVDFSLKDQMDAAQSLVRPPDEPDSLLGSPAACACLGPGPARRPAHLLRVAPPLRAAVRTPATRRPRSWWTPWSACCARPACARGRARRWRSSPRALSASSTPWPSRWRPSPGATWRPASDSARFESGEAERLLAPLRRYLEARRATAPASAEDSRRQAS